MALALISRRASVPFVGLRGLAAAAQRSLSSPSGVWVTVQVPENARAEFLRVMEADVKGSREEPGCLRFDLLDHGDGKYSFYEVYKDADSMAHHKTLPHCAPRTRTLSRFLFFNACGGVCACFLRSRLGGI
jgi:quinol monooxygenase YgiN